MILDWPTDKDIIAACVAQVRTSAYEPNMIVLCPKYRRLPRKLKKRLTAVQRLEVITGLRLQ